MICPNCDFEALDTMHYCGMCGTRLVKICTVCGVSNPLYFRFCAKCGTRFLHATTTPSKEIQTEPQQQMPSSTPLTPKQTPPPAEIPALSGERRVSTIILADVRSSTDLLEKVGTETWVEIMNHVFQILEIEIYRFGGKVDQFRGDGLVAFFGATSVHEDDPERAVLAALAMQQSIKPYAEKLAQEDASIDLRLRVGVNTGEVIVTSIGDSRKYSENTAMGEAVALAARMESAAEAGTVLISENTYRLVKNQFEWKPLGKIMVKGISHPIAVYRPLTMRADVELQQIYRLSNPLIGRDSELETLKELIEDLHYGIGGIVMLAGERGLGKSRLIAEIRHYVARQAALLREAYDKEKSTPMQLAKIKDLRGRCRSYHSQPYAIWLDLLRNWLGMRKAEPKAAIRKRLYQRCETLWDKNSSKHYPYLATLLSLPLEKNFQSQIKKMDAETLRQQFFITLRSWVEALAENGALVLTFTDMQWADTTSLDLLKYCLPLSDEMAIVWMLSFRPERSSPIWKFRYHVETEYPHRLTSLDLEPLTNDQSKAFMDQLIGPDILPPPTETLIIKKAEGNPYYIQELIRALIAQDILVQKLDPHAEDPQSAKKWCATQAVTSLTLPDSLQSLLLARINQLPPDVQHALQKASVIGKVFWSNLLSALIESTSNQKACLTALQRAQLIRERGRVPDLGIEYVFKSRLIRVAAYDSLLNTQRVTYHLQVAKHLETLLGDDICAQHYGLLAYHYRHAIEREKDLHYTLKAAKYAQKIYANAEAGKHYTFALEILSQMESQASPEKLRKIHEERFRVLDARREIFRLTGDDEQMWQDAKALLPIARKLADDSTWLIDALLQQPGVAEHNSQRAISDGIVMAEEALTLAQKLNDPRREMLCLIAITNQRLMLSDPTWQEVAGLALALARDIGDQRYEARLLIGLGRIYANSDQSARSMEYVEAAAALSVSQALDDKITQAALLDLLGFDLERSGDYYRLLREYQQERLLISREIGHRPMESNALANCACIQGIYLGDHAEGLNLLKDAQSIWGSAEEKLHLLIPIARILTDQGKTDAALDILQRIHALSTQTIFTNRIKATIHMTTAMIYNSSASKENLTKTLVLTKETQRLAESNPLVSRQYMMIAACKASEARLALAELQTKAKQKKIQQQKALVASSAALEHYHALGFVKEITCLSEEILFRHGQALIANDNQAEAIQYLRRAYDEMIRKYTLIPLDSHFRHSYLENIPLHRDIRTTYAARVGAILTESGKIHHLENAP